MKWIKASERLPEARKWKSLKLLTPNYSGSGFDTGWYNPDGGGYFVTISGHVKLDQIEWLDESTKGEDAPSEQDELWNEIWMGLQNWNKKNLDKYKQQFTITRKP